jgi:hypothetical protein
MYHEEPPTAVTCAQHDRFFTDVIEALRVSRTTHLWRCDGEGSRHGVIAALSGSASNPRSAYGRSWWSGAPSPVWPPKGPLKLNPGSPGTVSFEVTTEKALREWCEIKSIEIEERAPKPNKP